MMENEIDPGLRRTLPVLPLRDVVIFPHMVVSLFVGRERSVEALAAAAEGDGEILLLAQRDGVEDNPGAADLHSVGTIGIIVQKLSLPDGSVKVLVEGQQRTKVTRFLDDDPRLMSAEAVLLEEPPVPEEDVAEVEGLSRTLASQFSLYVRNARRVSQEVAVALEEEPDHSRRADIAAAHTPLKLPEKQKLLETIALKPRLESLLEKLQGELDLLKVEKRIRSRVRRQMERTQREYYLNEQLKAIQKELGDGEDAREEVNELEEKIKKTKFTKEAKSKAAAELRKLRNMNSISAEATVIRNYLDWLTAVPVAQAPAASSMISSAPKRCWRRATTGWRR